MRCGPTGDFSPADPRKSCPWLNGISCTDMTTNPTSIHPPARLWPENKAASRMTTAEIIIRDAGWGFAARALLRLQTWLSPTFPSGAYSYSHGLEWAVEAGYVHDRDGLVDWLDADLRHGSG